MTKPLKIRELKQLLLVELLKAQRKEGFGRYLEPKDVAEAAGLRYAPGQIRLCITDFENAGLIKGAFTMGGGPDGGMSSKLTARGVEEAEEIEEELANQPTQRENRVPASDRLVTIDHNSTALTQIQSSVELTLEEIRKQNDLDDQDLMLAAELRAALEIIRAPIVSAALLERVLIGSLRYFAEKFVENAVGMAAGAALTLAIQFFGFG